ncbi:LPS-assembly lipoprotein RlpB precursor [Vibrio maritimus]|uniref:LPS-assembly lipoprotein LptE n=1 Tax=Vibrio maritimus TaxID=990268 RepID=A0A090SZ64_9VIBR|nr:LPS-assembly lipoprotein RlpB precursor [Vibrio maritimus]
MRLSKNRLSRLFFVAFISTLLTACGFHLRGEYTVPEDIQQISVTSYDPYGMITRLVKEQLTLNKIEIVKPSSNVTNLHIVRESIGDRTLSLYQNTRAAEKELTYRVNYRVTVPQLGSKNFSAQITRSYLDNPLSALAKSEERSLIEDEMRSFSAQQMLRQMARLKTEIEEYEKKQQEIAVPSDEKNQS